MKIAYITAGAGGMYCGSCLLDNTLATELMASGHEVHLIPVYTPTRTDEPNVSEHRVFMGGINVYLQQRFGIFRETPGFIDRLWDALPLLRLATRWGIRVDPAALGDLTVSILRGSDGFQSKEIHKLAAFLKNEIDPDIIHLPNSLLIGLAPEFRARTRASICCTLQGEDLFLDGLKETHRNEALRLIRSGAVHVDAFLAVSAYYADFMAEYVSIPHHKIHVVPLGIHLDGHNPDGAAPGEPFTIGFMARIAPEKGLHVLCEIYRHLREKKGLPPSRLRAAGYLSAEHRPYLSDIQSKIRSRGLQSEFEYLGALGRQEKIAFLKSLHVLSVPSPYREPKGLYLLEAMANGVPVVQPRHGAFPEILEATGGGILVDPGDINAFAEAILSIYRNPNTRNDLGRRGIEGVRRHFNAALMAECTLTVYQNLLTKKMRQSMGRG